MKYLGCVN